MLQFDNSDYNTKYSILKIIKACFSQAISLKSC